MKRGIYFVVGRTELKGLLKLPQANLTIGDNFGYISSQISNNFRLCKAERYLVEEWP